MSKTARPAQKKAATKRPAVKKPPTKKAPARKAPARKAPARKRAPMTKAAVKKAAPKKAVARKPVSKRVPADVKAAVAAAKSKLAEDVTVLDLRNADAFTDFFIVCTGKNVRQVQAIADAVEADLKAKGEPPALVEGYRRGEWVLLDYFNFIVHVFQPAQRGFYDLERLWGGAEPVEVSAS